MTYWTLVFLILGMDGVYVGHVGDYKKMDECFMAWEELLNEVGEDGKFPINSHAVCVKSDLGIGPNT